MKITKSIVGLIGISLIVTGCQGSPDGASGTSGSENSETAKVLVVGADPTFRPISYENGDGKLTGFDVDFAQALADEMGYELEYKGIAWDGIIPALEAGKIDTITNMVITDERKKKVAFTDPYMKQTIMTVVRKDDDSAFKSLSDLKDANVGVMVGTAAGALADAEGFSNVTHYNNTQDEYQDLLLGRIDVVLIESFSGGYTVKDAYSEELRIDNSDIGGTPTLQAAALRLDDAEQLKAQNDGIKALLANGKLDAIVQKWFGDVDYRVSP